MTDTSTAAYNELKESGKLGDKQQMVLDVIKKHGPITIGECCKQHFAHVMERSISPRFAELERKGKIMKVGKRPCKTSGCTVYEWIAIDTAPEQRPQRHRCSACNGKGWITLTPEQQANVDALDSINPPPPDLY